MKLKKNSTHGITMILDAYNVIHAIPELERELDVSLERARAALIRYCCRFSEKKGNVGKMMLVFDGTRRKAYFDDNTAYYEGNCEIIFSDANQTADDKIIDLLQGLRQAEAVVVISNDNYVANGARAHQVRVIPVNEFENAARGISTSARIVSQGLNAQTARAITEEYRHHLGLK